MGLLRWVTGTGTLGTTTGVPPSTKGGPMGRFRNSLTRIGVAGAVSLVAGSMMIVGGVIVQQAMSGSAGADTSAFELFCTNTPIGNLVFNDVVISGTLTPSSPSPGEQFSLDNFQIQEPVPADIIQQASILGSTISGTSTATIAATGATPTAMPTGSLGFSQPLPNPVPSAGGTLDVPTTPITVGPFTANSSNVSLALGSAITLTITQLGTSATIGCSTYPNDTLPAGSGQATPPGLPISPVIAFAGNPPPPPPANQVTGDYELYCPHTPVGDLDFNDVTTSATISPDILSAGDQFHVTGYQTDIPVPAGAVGSAVGLGNSSFTGLAASNVDAYGASPSQVATGSMGFDLPIPDPIPSAGLPLAIPTTPIDVGPFTAIGGSITVAQDQSMLVVAKLSSKAFKMSCTAYPNDSIATSGSTGTPPAATPIEPIIAVASASGTPVTTTPTVPTGPPGTGDQTPGAPYEMYCPGTPVGDIAVNDVVTTGSISPTSLNEGDSFQVNNLQTQFTIPQSVAQQAEDLGLSSLSGDLSFFLDVTGTQYNGYQGVVTAVGATSTSASGTASADSPPITLLSGSPTTTIPVASAPIGVVPIGPFPGEEDLSFNVTLPSPVPSGGVQFSATPAPGSQPETFVAAGGPIDVFVSGINLDVSAFGDQFGLFCDTLADNSVPTGLSTEEPYNEFSEPLVTTGSATSIVSSSPTLALSSSTGLTNGQSISVTGSGYARNSPGNILECNDAPGEPTVALGSPVNKSLPVGCTSPTYKLITTSATGTLSTTYDVIQGTVGPPCGASNDIITQCPLTDSAGQSPATDAANYPCPPTAAQVAAGVTCTLQYGDLAGDSVTEPILFSGEPPPPSISAVASTPSQSAASPTTQPSATTSSTGSTSDPAASSSADPPDSTPPADPASSSSSADPNAVSASSGSLAFTGTGEAIGWLTLSGAALFLVGFVLLLLSDIPRRLIGQLLRQSRGFRV